MYHAHTQVFIEFPFLCRPIGLVEEDAIDEAIRQSLEGLDRGGTNEAATRYVSFVSYVCDQDS